MIGLPGGCPPREDLLFLSCDTESFQPHRRQTQETPRSCQRPSQGMIRCYGRTPASSRHPQSQGPPPDRSFPHAYPPIHRQCPLSFLLEGLLPESLCSTSIPSTFTLPSYVHPLPVSEKPVEMMNISITIGRFYPYGTVRRADSVVPNPHFNSPHTLGFLTTPFWCERVGTAFAE